MVEVKTARMVVGKAIRTVLGRLSMVVGKAV